MWEIGTSQITYWIGIDPHVPMDAGSKDLKSEVAIHLHADIQ
jgi:hypothetical protein